MDVPIEAIGVQLSQEFEALTWALRQALAWAAAAVTVAVAVAGVLKASGHAIRPRRFWCPAAVRDVEVVFEEWGPPGLRRPVRIATCSAFEPASAARCRRGCLDTTYRRCGAPFGPPALHARPG
jgi:hypothetical protein